MAVKLELRSSLLLQTGSRGWLGKVYVICNKFNHLLEPFNTCGEKVRIFETKLFLSEIRFLKYQLTEN